MLMYKKKVIVCGNSEKGLSTTDKVLRDIAPGHAKSVAALEKKFICQAIPITSGHGF